MTISKKILFTCVFLITSFLITQGAFAGAAGYSADHGTLGAYTSPTPIDGSGKKLLAIYMVGSDLESGNGAGTTDFNELITGYDALATKNVEVIVAFGGADKSGWKGMKFANMTQIKEDGTDGVYGNGSSYLYQADLAHMGDESSLKLFLEYVKEGYTNFDGSFLVFWDHGGAYTGFGNDENYNNDLLTLAEIDNALTKSSVGKFDMIGYDACLMGSVEVARFMKTHADYQLGSEELEPGHGWLWSNVISELSTKTTIKDAGKGIIDNFVQDVHEYSTDGKTLSLLDLSKYDTLQTKIDAFTTAFATNLLTDSDYKNALIYGSTNVRDFGKQSKEDQRTSIDLKHFAQLIKSKITNADAQTMLDELITAVDNFVVHSKEDGTRPNSMGASIAPPEEKDSDYDAYKLNTKWLNFQIAFSNLSTTDTTAPAASEVNNEASAEDLEWGSDINWDDWENWAESGDWEWETASVKNASKSTPLPFLSGERALFVNGAEKMPLSGKRTSSGVKGVSAKFSDDTLAKVTTIFGFEMAPYEDDADDKFFMSVAEVEAFETSTQGQYFTPQWNKKWYCVEYDPTAEMTEWMPMIFIGRYTKDGETYTEYAAEIDYYESGKDYSDYDFPADYATLRIIVNSKNEVASHYVQTYRLLFSSADDTEGSVLIDKKTKTIASGDKIQFWTYGFNLADPNADDWFETSDIITFTQAPKFTVEELEFEDESGNLLEYKYAMWAEDIGKNGTLTTPVKASTSDDTSDDGKDDADDDDDDDDKFYEDLCFISATGGSANALVTVCSFVSIFSAFFILANLKRKK